jgi:hypothetical protein
MTGMPDNVSLKELILSSKKAANADIEAIESHCPLTKEFFEEKLTDYVLHKYLLTREDYERAGGVFNDLTELSLAKSMKISKELVREFDLAKSCDGVSSAMAKKVLLFRSIEKAFDIQLPAKQTAKFKYLSELSDMTWEALHSRDKLENS